MFIRKKKKNPTVYIIYSSTVYFRESKWLRFYVI